MVHPPLTGRTPDSIHLLIEEYLMQILWELLGLSCEADPAVERKGMIHQDWAAQEWSRQGMSF